MKYANDYFHETHTENVLLLFSYISSFARANSNNGYNNNSNRNRVEDDGKNELRQAKAKIHRDK